MGIAIGDPLPSGELHENDPFTKVEISQEVQDGYIIFVPGMSSRKF